MAIYAPPTRRMTLEEFQKLPEGPPYYEFEEGELILMASPLPLHQDILSELHVVCRRFVNKNKLGRIVMEIDVNLPDERGYIPDLTFVESAKLDIFSPIDKKIHGAPTMVAEIVSSDDARDRVHKFKVYHDNGIPWYWLITQELAIEEYHATPQGYLRTASIEAGEVFKPGVFPGLEINLKTLLGLDEEDAAATGEEAAAETETNETQTTTQEQGE